MSAVEQHRLRTVRAELWRDGEMIEETPIDEDGWFRDRLFPKPGDSVYLVHESASLVRRVDRPMMIDRTLTR